MDIAELMKSVLVGVWIGGTALLAIGFLITAIVYLIRVAKHRSRPTFLGLAVALIMASTVSFMANPLINLILFMDYADRRTSLMEENMRNQNLIGQQSSVLIQRFGPPRRVEPYVENCVTWIYNPNPWFIGLGGMDDIQVFIENDTITGLRLYD